MEQPIHIGIPSKRGRNNERAIDLSRRRLAGRDYRAWLLFNKPCKGFCRAGASVEWLASAIETVISSIRADVVPSSVCRMKVCVSPVSRGETPAEH
jgi:hypothetical protein